MCPVPFGLGMLNVDGEPHDDSSAKGNCSVNEFNSSELNVSDTIFRLISALTIR